MNLVKSDPDKTNQILCMQVSLYYMKSSCMLFIGGLMVAIAGCLKNFSCITKDDFMIKSVLKIQIKHMKGC